jgi:hypothetical protein
MRTWSSTSSKYDDQYDKQQSKRMPHQAAEPPILTCVLMWLMLCRDAAVISMGTEISGEDLVGQMKQGHCSISASSGHQRLDLACICPQASILYCLVPCRLTSVTCVTR